MFKLYNNSFMVEIFFDHFESKCIERAVEDLQNDIMKISGSTVPVVKKYLPLEEEGFIVIGSLENERFKKYLDQVNIAVPILKGEWERYVIKTIGENDENLLICGSDCRGTMWGIYQFCEEYLGIDPLYFWTDNEPEKKSELAFDQIEVVSGPVTFKFRGWFINDEDLLTEWKNGGGIRYIDYPYYHQVTHQSIIEKVIETALRLKQNLMIPASFIDIDNPAEENLVRMVTERGMFISQHHVEPMGVSHFGWDNFWEKRDQDVEASYVLYPEKFEEIWTYYAKKWAKYENVIWQFGLRGRGDRPVWFHDENVSPSMEERGKLISNAISKQDQIVEKVVGNKDYYSTTTLWMEGTELHNDCYLTFPDDTMIIFADKGSTQMWGEDFYTVDRKADKEYGLYYHVAFWGDGPHLVQGTPLNKMYYNYKQAIEKGDTTYSILNVTSIREVVLGVKANSIITWNFDSFNPKEFLVEWCEEQFGKNTAPMVSDLYNSFYDGYYQLDNSLIEGHKLFIDGMARRVGLKLLDIIQGNKKESGFNINDKSFDLFGFKSLEEFIKFYKDITTKSLDRWKDVYSEAYQIFPGVCQKRQQFFIDNLVVQLEIIIGLYSWVNNLAKAAENIYNSNTSSGKEYIKKAVYSMEKLLIDRTKAEHGKWNNWYRGDKKMNLPEVLDKTKEIERCVL